LKKATTAIAALMIAGASALGCGNAQTSQTSGSSGAGGHDSGPPPSCVPSMNPKAAVDDTCGVFVSPEGDDQNPGTKEKPLKSVKAALAKKDSTIYACAGATPFTEAVTLDKAVTLFGALDCATWLYNASAKTQLTAGADEVPLTVSASASGSAVYDVAIAAVDAKKAGGSSIAVIVDGAELELVRCDLTAGKGADGAPGVPPSGSGQQGAAAPMPTPATALDGCVMGVNVVAGGLPGQSMCGSVDTSGGLGGSGTNLPAGGGPGGDAQPQPQPNAQAPKDGKAGKAQDMTSCDPGHAGADGLPGTMPGAGATGIGDITAAGYQAPTATPGQSAGTPGYGGGGGGGAKKCANGYAGPAGGGGGAGGCGGQPGSAGGSAGGSFGLVSLNATVSLDAVAITTANGGTGGVGGDGQPGGQGGSGGSPGSSNGDGSVSACNGGKGGQGGRGSSGGGGLGGHSIGIAFKGKAPVQKSVTVQHGNGGTGGIGGDMDQTSPGIVGGNGLGCATLDFAKPTSCTM
jgi:hypothetical protein